jgi:hypothetical protein
MKRSRVGNAIHRGRLVLLFLLVALIVGTAISDLFSHKYGQGAGLLVAAAVVVIPNALLRWYPQAFSFGSADRPEAEQYEQHPRGQL